MVHRRQIYLHKVETDKKNGKDFIKIMHFCRHTCLSELHPLSLKLHLWLVWIPIFVEFLLVLLFLFITITPGYDFIKV